MAPEERKARTEHELRDASNDLYYEFWMFIKLANGLAAGIMGDSILNNALLESFAVHAHSVLNFLYNDDAEEDNVAAVDYLSNPEDWPYDRPKKSEVLGEIEADVQFRIANQIAHFTYDRHNGTPARKPWPYMQIAKEVTAAFDVFLELVPPHLLGPRWQEFRGQRRQHNGVS